MLVQYDALETGQKEIDSWLNNCEKFLSTLKLSKNPETLHNDTEYLKASFLSFEDFIFLFFFLF